MKKIGSISYKLELQPTIKIHPIFHVSCLKKVIGQSIPTQIVLPELDEEGRIILETRVHSSNMHKEAKEQNPDSVSHPMEDFTS